MKLFRNREVIGVTVFSIIIGAFFTLLGGFFISFSAGLLLCAACALFYTVWMITAARHYRKMSGLAADIDRMLHSGEMIDLTSFREGELSLLEAELAKLMARLREQNEQLKKEKVRMADSIADISHQIRTPLTTANLLLASLKRTAAEQEWGNDEVRLQLVELTRLLERVEWLVEALLKMAKLDAETVRFREEKLTFAEVVEKAAEPLAIPMELREQKLVCDLNGGFLGDRLWTTEAVGNILKNCMEHTPVGGTITVEGCENALYSRLVIRDTGAGISKDDLPHLFERFYKGENSAPESAGIGLALAKSIISHQNGRIRAGNHPGGGAEFEIRFYKAVV